MSVQPESQPLALYDAPTTHDAITRAAVNALATDPHLYAHRGHLAHVRETPYPRVEPLNDAHLAEALWRNAPWNAYLEQHQLKFPKWIISHLLKRTDWPNFRQLGDVIDTPLFRRDGSLVGTSGFDPATGYFFCPRVEVALAERPTQAEARAAFTTLDQLASHFPFETLTHRSAFIAALLTPFARETFQGGAPLFFLDAPDQYMPRQLADVISTIVAGRDVIQMEKSPSERAFRKQVARTYLRGESLVLLSDTDAFRGARGIRTALLSREWIDGDERTRDARPVTWLAASDNALVNRHVAPLVLPIRTRAIVDLVDGTYYWSLPVGFSEQLKENRARYVHAALTILRAYDLAGRPAQSLDTWPEFAGWARTVAGALVWAGGINPLIARRDVFSSLDEEPGDIGVFLHAFLALNAGEKGITVGEILHRFEAPPPELTELADALDNLAPKGWRTSRKLGALFKRIQRQSVTGLVLERAGEDRHRYSRWIVRRTAESVALEPKAPSHDLLPVTVSTPEEAPTAESRPAELPAPSHERRSEPAPRVTPIASLTSVAEAPSHEVVNVAPGLGRQDHRRAA
jgi:putative DNA primase/helicase